MLDPHVTVARVVLDHSETAPIFQRHRIDYCCHGDVSIEAACAAARIDTQDLLDELSQAIAQRSGTAERDLRTLSTAGLIAHIVGTHHEYLRATLPFVRALANKVHGAHAARNPNLSELEAIVGALDGALVPHLDAEEQTLFPILMSKAPDEMVVSRELASMHEDHVAVGEMLQRMRELADDYTAPDWACNSYRTLLAELEQLERDTLTHVHLENHVLMPRFVKSA